MKTGAASYRVLTPPPSGSAAIAIIELCGDVDAALARLDIRGVPIGGAPLRDLAGVDRGIVARPSRDVVYLMPHAGPAVLRRLFMALERAGVSHDSATAPAYPEAAGEVESRVLAALARAASPLAIDLLLDQPRRWGAAAPEARDDAATVARSAVLNRLITPPLVVALGRPNIGKSSLLNALAGREVAIVADAPGTTRDHVGVYLNFAGLVVRYIDAPGLDVATAADPILAEAQSLALSAAAAADLILLCADPSTPAPPNPCPHVPVLGLVLRADLAAGALPPGPIAVSARTGEGVAELVRAIRDHLVPPEALAHPGPWRFWGASGAP